MARRSIYKILLPAMRFLAMVNAFLGLIYYEEKDGHLSTEVDTGKHFLFPLGDNQDLAAIPKIFSLRPWKKRKLDHLEHSKESIEEELPETSIFHLALTREVAKRKRKKIVWTPFGEFTISELCTSFQMPKRLLV